MTAPLPILYSFRRCPYAMRARMAVRVAQQTCELREVILRDKPDAMIEVSPKATVPVLVLPGGKVIDESFDIMLWALKANDSESLLEPEQEDLAAMVQLIDRCENEYKPHLDRYKYANRYEDTKPEEHRARAEVFLSVLEARLVERACLFGERKSLADFAIAPFIRQFANTDRERFDASPYPAVQGWLDAFLASDTFTSVMTKFSQWHEGDDPVYFPFDS